MATDQELMAENSLLIMLLHKNEELLATRQQLNTLAKNQQNLNSNPPDNFMNKNFEGMSPDELEKEIVKDREIREVKMPEKNFTPLQHPKGTTFAKTNFGQDLDKTQTKNKPGE